ncbi:cytochrome c oxidase assembly protein [Rhodocista pekingensis]|uniref:Cytochrome c oxidase assembly protein n=1 Tax=Rhodocista pekingensis TaxID=201185 RepID=A0ABW2KTN6_9PROT
MPVRRWAWPALVPAVLFPTDAAAHPGTPWIGPNELPYAWTLDPVSLLPLALAWWLFGRGLARRPSVGRSRAAAYAAGTAWLLLALVWPLDAWGETLFSAHMAQHLVLTVVAPPLLLLARPAGPVLAGLPTATLRRRGARGLRAVRRGLEPLLRPGPAALVHGLALWLWHAPVAFDAALADDWLHRAEHLSFFATALLFWAMVLRAPRLGGMAPVAAAGALLLTLMHSGLLGMLIAFAPVPLYAWYGPRTAAWGLTPLEDQQLAGLVMWVPAGFAYMGAGLWLLAGWMNRTGPGPSATSPGHGSGALAAGGLDEPDRTRPFRHQPRAWERGCGCWRAG